MTKSLLFLVIEGEPTEEQLEAVLLEAWLAINSQFIDIIDDVEAKAYNVSLNRLAAIAARIEWVRMATSTLRIHPQFHGLIDHLKKEGFARAFDPENREEFFADLDYVDAVLISDEIELSEGVAKMKQTSDTTPRREDTEESFSEMLFEIHATLQMKYRPEELTTRDYALLLKRLKKHYANPPKPALPY